MPIKPELLHFYRTPKYKAARARVVERAGNKCEQCGKPNGEKVETVSWKGLGGCPIMLWRMAGSSWWCWQNGKISGSKATDEFFEGRAWRKDVRTIRVVLTMAHLDHTPGNDADDNLKLLCQFCHLNYDALHHKQTRSKRKDGKRPILQGETANA